MNKTMKICALLIAGMMLFTACTPSDGGNVSSETETAAQGTGNEAQTDVQAQPAETQEEATAAPEEKTYKIGVIQLVEHESLDAACKGFTDKLDELGIKYELDFQNAQNDQSNLKTISQRFVANEVDLILAIATPAAQAIANETKDIPILCTAITDYVAASLVESNEVPGANVSGTTDMSPIAEQIALIKTLVPSVQTVGLMYSSNEQNSIVQIDIAKQALDDLGLSYVESTVTSVNDIQQAVQALEGKVQAIYIPTDNTLAAAMPTVAGVATPAKIPVVTGATGMVFAGGTATVGLNYYNLGAQTGEMAYRLLVEGEDISTMPVEKLEKFDFAYNEENVETLGISLPEDLVRNAIEPDQEETVSEG